MAHHWWTKHDIYIYIYFYLFIYKIYILIYISFYYILYYIYIHIVFIHIMCLYFVCTYTSTVSICIWHDVTILYVDILVHIEIHYSYHEIARLWIYSKGFKHDQTNGCDPVYNQLQSWATRNLSVRCLWDRSKHCYRLPQMGSKTGQVSGIVTLATKKFVTENNSGIDGQSHQWWGMNLNNLNMRIFNDNYVVFQWRADDNE